MNIKQINPQLYINMDEFILMNVKSEVVKDTKTLKEVLVHVVEGVTKSNLQIVVYTDAESGAPTKCVNWIHENWLKTYSRKSFWGKVFR
jgi:hypothetical protein